MPFFQEKYLPFTLESSDELTLKEVSEKLGISLTMYSDIEKDRKILRSLNMLTSC